MISTSVCADLSQTLALGHVRYSVKLHSGSYRMSRFSVCINIVSFVISVHGVYGESVSLRAISRSAGPLSGPSGPPLSIPPIDPLLTSGTVFMLELHVVG